MADDLKQIANDIAEALFRHIAEERTLIKQNLTEVIHKELAIRFEGGSRTSPHPSNGEQLPEIPQLPDYSKIERRIMDHYYLDLMKQKMGKNLRKHYLLDPASFEFGFDITEEKGVEVRTSYSTTQSQKYGT